MEDKDTYNTPIIVKLNKREKDKRVKLLESSEELHKLCIRYDDGENIYIKYQGEIMTPNHFNNKYLNDYWTKRSFERQYIEKILR